jgi:hypothetical protein
LISGTVFQKHLTPSNRYYNYHPSVNAALSENYGRAYIGYFTEHVQVYDVTHLLYSNIFNTFFHMRDSDLKGNIRTYLSSKFKGVYTNVVFTKEPKIQFTQMINLVIKEFISDIRLLHNRNNNAGMFSAKISGSYQIRTISGNRCHKK